MEKGWDAKGRLRPLWSRLEGKRDELAALTGIGGNTLSAYNSGARPLGIVNATRIADALGVSVPELGGPSGSAGPNEQSIPDRLDELATKLADAIESERKARREIQTLRARVQALEAWRAQSEGGATGQP